MSRQKYRRDRTADRTDTHDKKPTGQTKRKTDKTKDKTDQMK